MQSTYQLEITDITPVRGIVLVEAEPMQYETASGLIAIKSLKKNPKLEKGLCIAVGGPFWIHGGGEKGCGRCHPICDRPAREGTYWAAPGDTVWMKRGFKPGVFQGKLYLFVPNEDILTTWREG